jgi:hypothetical protein
MINIVTTKIEYLTLKESKLFDMENDIFFVVNLFLDKADLSNISDSNKVFDSEQVFKIDKNKLIEEVKKKPKVRIWSSLISTNNYLAFLYVLDILKDCQCEISVVLSKKPHLLEICYCGPKKIEELLAEEKIITKQDYENYLKEWHSVITSKKQMRIMHSQKLKLIDESFYDKYILMELKENGRITISQIISNIMKKYIKKIDISDGIIENRIYALIELGKLKKYQKHEAEYFLIANVDSRNEILVEIN